jgi:hypothetical protein
MKKFVIIGILLLAAVFVSGCFNVAMYTTVQKDGNISDMKLAINTTSSVYSYISTAAHTSGYSTVKEYMLSNLSQEYGTSLKNADYSEQWSGDHVTMTMTMQGSFKPDDSSGMKIYRDGDYMVFKYVSTATPTPTPTPGPYDYMYNDSELSGLSDMMLSGITLDYYLTMPGKIIDTNANVVNGNKAEWHLSGKDMSNMNMYAKSEVPKTPGFGAILAIAGILAGYYMLARKKED